MNSVSVIAGNGAAWFFEPFGAAELRCRIRSEIPTGIAAVELRTNV